MIVVDAKDPFSVTTAHTVHVQNIDRHNVHVYMYSRRQKKRSVSVPFRFIVRSVPFRFSSRFPRFLAVPFRSVRFRPFNSGRARLGARLGGY